MVLFAAGQLFINYKHGVVFSPFYHYGMYSDVIKVYEHYGVFEVKANGELLAGKDYSPQQWDKIITPLYYYKNIRENSNKMYENDIERLMKALHLSPDEKHYVQTCDEASFISWYKRNLENITGKTIQDVHVKFRTYSYSNAVLQPTDTVYSLNQLCP